LFEVLLSPREDLGMNQKVADVACGSVLGQVIEELVGDLRAAGGQCGEETGAWTCAEPCQD
jgi:hypothetical protein